MIMKEPLVNETDISWHLLWDSKSTGSSRYIGRLMNGL